MVSGDVARCPRVGLSLAHERRRGDLSAPEGDASLGWMSGGQGDGEIGQSIRAVRPSADGVGLALLLLWCFGSLPAAEAQIISGSYVGNGIAGRAITGLGFRPDIVIVKVDFDGQTDATPPCSSLDDCSSAVIRTSTMAGTNSKPVKGNQAYAGQHDHRARPGWLHRGQRPQGERPQLVPRVDHDAVLVLLGGDQGRQQHQGRHSTPATAGRSRSRASGSPRSGWPRSRPTPPRR